MNEKIYFADAFTDSIGKGNRVGVIYNPNHSIDPEKYCALAAELNVSEIALIMSDQEVDYEFRFFAPKEEVALCGHGTIGSLALLYKLNIENSNQPNLKIRLKAGIIEGGMISDKLFYMKQSLPKFYSAAIDVERVAKILGIDRKDIVDDEKKLPLQVVSTGRAKLMIPISSLNSLFAIKANYIEMEKYCREIDANGFHLFTLETMSGQEGVHARHFAPTAGVLEDPVTGSANGAMGAYLVNYGMFDNGKTTNIFVEQGHVLNREGQMVVEISKDADDLISGVKICGDAVLVNNEGMT